MMHNTHEMAWTGEYWRTAPFSRAVYHTSATSVQVFHWNDVFEAQPNAAEFSVLVDGNVIHTEKAGSMGAGASVVPLPAGEKVVEIVTSGHMGLGGTATDRPVTFGRSLYLVGVDFNASAANIPPERGGLLVLTDSIGNGSTLTSPTTQAYPTLLRQKLDHPVHVLGRGGMALYDVTTRVGEQPAFFLPKLEREVLKLAPKGIVFTLGYNDANKGVAASVVGQALRDFADAVAELSPDTKIFLTGMTPAVSPPPNYDSVNDRLFSYTSNTRNVIQATDWRTGVIDTSMLNDNVHPNAEAHGILARYLERQLPDYPYGDQLYLYDSPVHSEASVFAVGRSGRISNNMSVGTHYMPNMWWLGDPPVAIGDSYEVWFDLEAGTAEGTFGQWLWLKETRYVTFGTGNFRTKVTIRNRTDHTETRSCRIWKGLPPTYQV